MSLKTPRNVSGSDLVKLLAKYGYEVVRQKGSHIRLSRLSDTGAHHLTIPNHDPLKLGTLNAILSEVADHLKIGKEELINKL
ncbi:MAG: type II toxin-antitoxin system HicA family toxin [Bacteroidetes bacterium]|jgi:predicted RNA binding protein YcfA (HicA-like mRNA interferase family)|nr:type II toxin-antitoxin system HicA family toxin [Bacteroidota bacterium]